MVRFRDPKKIFEEMEDKHRKYGIDLFIFNDDSFTIRKDMVMNFCDSLIEGGLNRRISWKCDTRVNLVDYQLLKKMKEAGCVQIDLGIECGNDNMLEYVKKGITIEQVLKAFEIANEIGIGTLAYFMMGFPDETQKDIEDTIRLMKKVKPSHPCWSIATPYPGTELYDICKSEGLIREDVNWSTYHHHSKNVCFSKQLTQEELLHLAERIERITFIMKLRYYLTHPRRLLKELKIL